GEPCCQYATRRTAADNDHVVMIGHGKLLALFVPVVQCSDLLGCDLLGDPAFRRSNLGSCGAMNTESLHSSRFPRSSYAQASNVTSKPKRSGSSTMQDLVTEDFE